MTIITRFSVAFVLIAAAIPLAAALPGYNSNESSCQKEEFWYEEKKCCLPRGGQSWHPQPPPEKQCPPSGWSWNDEHDCCVPHQPPPPFHPPPQCPKEWDWSPATYCCERSPHHPQPPPPKPSGGYSGWKRGEHDESSCKKEEFWFDERNCCLPRGGPSWHPSPPPEKKCPHSEWSWSEEHDCCIPHHPSPPPPKCDDKWEWSNDDMCCKQPPPPPPRPSGGHVWKRESLAREPQLCPMGLTACPISSASGLSADFECLDTANEFESCGGCASIGRGQDCTAIEGAWNVGCEQGSCAVYTCAPGFKLSNNGTSCDAI